MATLKRITEITIHYTSGRTRKLNLRGEIHNGSTWSILFAQAAGSLRIPAHVRVESDVDVVVFLDNVEDVEALVRDAVQ
jgi:hypothetical protein